MIMFSILSDDNFFKCLLFIKCSASDMYPIFFYDYSDTTVKKQIFIKLLASGASVNVHDRNGQSLIERVLLLKQTVPYSQPYWLLGFMRTVHVTAPHPEISELLTLMFSRGADVNIVGKDGNTPLFTAINEEMFKTAIDLIERGADVNHIGANNLTTLECCYAVFKKSNKESRSSYCRYQIYKELYLLKIFYNFS